MALHTNFKWESAFDHKYILRQLHDCRSIKNGKVSFKANDAAWWRPILSSAIGESLEARHLKSVCIKNALSDPSLNFSDADAFLNHCEATFQSLKNKNSKFVVIFHFTYSGPRLFTRLKDGNVVLRWPSKSDRQLAKIRKAQKKELSVVLKQYSISGATDGLTSILVELTAYNTDVAYEIAASAFDRVRGVLNFLVNFQRVFSVLRGLEKPHAINRFRPGPFASIHKPDGSTAIGQVWYEPQWHHDKASVKFDGDLNEIQKDIRRWWKKASGNQLQKLISEGLVRYCRALDQHDTDACFIALWGALETLTGTVNAQYDVTVSRLEKIFKKESAITRQTVQHLRKRRNRTVHSARSVGGHEAFVIIDQAEFAVRRVLLFLLNNDQRFKSETDLFAFLDLPLNPKVLRRDEKLIRSFIKYHGFNG